MGTPRRRTLTPLRVVNELTSLAGEIERYRSRGRDGFGVPAASQGLLFGEVRAAGRFLDGLSPTVATRTRFALWNPDEHSVPVNPRRVKVGDLTGS